MAVISFGIAKMQIRLSFTNSPWYKKKTQKATEWVFGCKSQDKQASIPFNNDFCLNSLRSKSIAYIHVNLEISLVSYRDRFSRLSNLFSCNECIFACQFENVPWKCCYFIFLPMFLFCHFWMEMKSTFNECVCNVHQCVDLTMFFIQIWMDSTKWEVEKEGRKWGKLLMSTQFHTCNFVCISYDFDVIANIVVQ